MARTLIAITIAIDHDEAITEKPDALLWASLDHLGGQ